MEKFKDQVVLITGGAQGIGRAIAEKLLSEGAIVVIADIEENCLANAKAFFAEYGKQVATYPLDVSSEESVKTLIEYLERDFNRLDVVVNSAGIVGPNGKKITSVSLEDFERTCAINLKGAFLISKYSIPLMEKNGYGRILLIASIAGKEGNEGMCAYSASKAAVIGLAKSIGKEYAQTDIKINALAPAVIRTGLVDSMEKAQIKYMEDKIPMKRFGTLKEIAELTAFIVSRENGFTTAFTYDMSGGRATY